MCALLKKNRKKNDTQMRFALSNNGLHFPSYATVAESSYCHPQKIRRNQQHLYMTEKRFRLSATYRYSFALLFFSFPKQNPNSLKVFIQIFQVILTGSFHFTGVSKRNFNHVYV